MKPINRERAVAHLMAALVALAAASPAGAKPWTAVCSNLSGMKVDEAGGQPAFANDAIEGATWRYDWDSTSRKATLTLPASHASDGKAHMQEGVANSHKGGFYTIVSSLPGAVWTHAIYPETGRLLAVQSTTKGGTGLSGRMLVGSCTISSR